MSLDIMLMGEDPKKQTAQIFIREDGQNKAISREEWDARFPGREPILILEEMTYELYSANITHNLNSMAGEAGIYEVLWRAPENGIDAAVQLIQPLTEGLDKLLSDPARFMPFNPKNGWGDYDGLVSFVRDLLDACKRYPEARIETSR